MDNSSLNQYLKQLSTDKSETERLSTNIDNLHEPIHRWFPFLAGFSHNLVQGALNHFSPEDNPENFVVFDPFTGSGTTAVVGKQLGHVVLGNETNPLLYKISKVKVRTNIDSKEVLSASKKLLKKARTSWERTSIKNENELLQRCYSRDNLKKLVTLRESLNESDIPESLREYMFMALTMSLPKAAKVGISVPYVSWNNSRTAQSAFSAFSKGSEQIAQDLDQSELSSKGKAKLFLHDSRHFNTKIQPKSVDLIFTSPPYLNNLDYGEALKVQLYFWKIADSRSDVYKKIQNHAVASATTYYNTQATHEKTLEDLLGSEVQNSAPKVFDEIVNKAKIISRLKVTRLGGKSFDFLSVLYFHDMFKCLREMQRVLKPEQLAFLIIGDSAPYGVHIPTDTYLGEMAIEMGFSSYTLQPLRTRGEKWKSLRFRHKHLLRETMLVLRR